MAVACEGGGNCDVAAGKIDDGGEYYGDGDDSGSKCVLTDPVTPQHGSGGGENGGGHIKGERMVRLTRRCKANEQGRKRKRARVMVKKR
jgi:hypothetical protein